MRTQHRPSPYSASNASGARSPHGDAPDTTTFGNPFDDHGVLAYYEQLREWHGYIRFLGLPHLRDRPDVPIEDLYVVPEWTERHISPTEEDLTEGHIGLLDALTEHRRVVVLGDPGTGKSTLVSWLVWQLTRSRRNPYCDRLGLLLPVPIVVRDLALGPDITWDRLLEMALKHKTCDRLTREALAPWLARGQAMIMVDGLDEISDLATREALRRAVWDGFDRLPACRWLLTSRIVGYDELPFDHQQDAEAHAHKGRDIGTIGRLPADDLSTFGDAPTSRVPRAALRYIAPFSDAQIQRFARAWYQRIPGEAAPVERSKELMTALEQHEGTRKLARVPQLLTLIALIHRIEAQLPQGRFKLYQKIVEAYLESIDQYRGILEGGYSLEEKKRWLAYVGLRMQCRRSRHAAEAPEQQESGPREILVERRDLLTWVGQAMELSPHDVTDKPDAASSFIDYIARRSGLLLPRGEDAFAFVHLTFQEYFAAEHFLENVLFPGWWSDDGGHDGEGPTGDSLADLQAYAADPTWRETIVLLFGLLAGRPRQAQLLANRLFGEAFEALNEEDGGYQRAIVLAEIAADKHSGLPGQQRNAAREACWRRELREQDLVDDTVWKHQAQVARALLGNEPSRSSSTWAALLAVAPPTLGQLSLNGTQVQDLKPLQTLTDLRHLFLNGTNVQDLEPLKSLSNLHVLILSNSSQTKDLQPLEKLSNLMGLVLNGTNVQDLEPLKNLSNLNDLYFNDTNVQDLTPLQDLSNLETLYLSRTQIQDLAPLQDLSNLESLYLNDTNVQDLTPLQNLHNLKTLDLDDTNVQDLTPLQNLHSLESLYLNDTNVQDLTPLQNLHNLKTLHLSDTQVLDLQPLQELAALKELFLGGKKVDDLHSVVRPNSHES